MGYPPPQQQNQSYNEIIDPYSQTGPMTLDPGYAAPNQYQSTVDYPPPLIDTSVPHPPKVVSMNGYDILMVWDPVTGEYGASEVLGRTADVGGVGGGGGSMPPTWRPGELELEQAGLAEKREADFANIYLQGKQLELQQLQNQWQSAAAMGDLALKAQIEERMRITEQEAMRAQQVAQRLQAQTQLAQIGSENWATGVSGRSSLANTQSSLAQAAAQAAANPRDTFAYLNLMKALGGSALTTAAPGDARAQYADELAAAFQKNFGGTADMLQQAWQDTYNAPTPQIDVPTVNAPSLAALPKPTQVSGVATAYATANPQQKADLDRFFAASEDDRRRLAGQPTVAQQQAVGSAYTNATPEQIEQLNRFFGATEEQRRALAGTPAMAGGGDLTLTEPAVLYGLETGIPQALMGEAGPEKLEITPMKKFASGGAVKTKPNKYAGKTKFGLPDPRQYGVGTRARADASKASGAARMKASAEYSRKLNAGEFHDKNAADQAFKAAWGDYHPLGRRRGGGKLPRNLGAILDQIRSGQMGAPAPAGNTPVPQQVVPPAGAPPVAPPAGLPVPAPLPVTPIVSPVHNPDPWALPAYATGGTVDVLTDEEQVSSNLGDIFQRRYGTNWGYARGRSGWAPRPGLFNDRSWMDLQKTPSLYNAYLAAMSRGGIAPEDVLAERQRYTHRAPAYGYGGFA